LKLVALLIAISCLNPVSVNRFFGADHAMALKQLANHANQMNDIAAQYKVNTNLVKGIVFPEYIRNSVFSGMMEEQALGLSYVEFGSNAVDFSIGQFQIKPSFAKKLEIAVSENKALKVKYPDLCINHKLEKTQRLIRFNRLKDLNWQTRYVCCFIDYCLVKYDLNKLSEIEQLKFLATAYNVGIKETAKMVEANYSVKAFPYGQRFKIDQLAYWEVSVDYYLKYCNTFSFEK
jgi:hypothetical protein